MDLSEIDEVLTGQDITGTQVAVAAVLVLIGVLLYWLLGSVLRRTFRPLTPNVIPVALADVLVRFSQLLVFGVFFAWALSVLGAAVGWLTFLAIGLLAIALLVAKPFLDGLVSSALVVSRSALVVGTEIEVDGIVGEVKGIARRSTIVESRDGRVVYIPNVELLDKTITVLSAGEERRSTVDLTVDMSADLEKVESVLREALVGVPAIRRVGGIRAQSFSEGIDLSVSFWHGSRLTDRGEAVDAAIRCMKVALEEAGGRLVFGPTKTYDDRTIIIPGFLRDLLAEHLATQTGPEESALVFTAPEGGPLRHANFYKRVWRSAKQAAGVPEDLRIHDLRHTCAALLIAQGASPKAIQAHLGHSSIQVTFDRYGHLFPEDLEDLAARLDAAREISRADHTRTKRGPGVVELPTERPKTAL